MRKSKPVFGVSFSRVVARELSWYLGEDGWFSVLVRVSLSGLQAVLA